MLKDLLSEIVNALEAREIPYMVSGSLAMSAYTIPRMTRDIDIIIDVDREDIDKLVTIFDRNFYVNTNTVIEEIGRRGMFNAIDHRSGYKIDFVVKKNVPYRKLEFQRKKRATILGVEAWLVSPEDLVLSKIIWIQEIQSEKQKEDILNLLQNPDLDLNYIKTWIKALNLSTFKLL
jgi:hypothetical protein